MYEITDLVDAFERVTDLEADLKKLSKQWDDLYEENLALKAKLEKVDGSS